MTILVVTHEHDIAAYAARHIVMKDGRIVIDQLTSEINQVSS